MTQNHISHSPKKPLYVSAWHAVHHFPKRLALGATEAPKVSGPAAAALLSASFSCFLLMVNQHLTSIFPMWNEWIWRLGDWIPGSKTSDPIYGEIGSYTGKQTVMLLGWLGSWLLLGMLWKDKQISFPPIVALIIFFIAAATVMNWHPLFPYLPLAPKS